MGSSRYCCQSGINFTQIDYLELFDHFLFFRWLYSWLVLPTINLMESGSVSWHGPIPRAPLSPVGATCL